jgi:hypothetical protein
MHENESHESQRIHPLVKDKTGLSLGYRIMWRIRYAANDIYGPASRQPGLNPREQLRVERAERVATAYRVQGKEPPPEVRRAAGDDSGPEYVAEGRHGRPPKPFQEGWRYIMIEDDAADGPDAAGATGAPGQAGTPDGTDEGKRAAGR